MTKKIITILIILFASQTLTSKIFNPIPLINSFKFNNPLQGGILEFNSSTVERFENSVHNSDSLLLRNYSGRPLKALQFDVIIGKIGGKLKLKSVNRGMSIPESSFLFDYEIYKDNSNDDGTSIDVLRVVILGNGENVLLPGNELHIISLIYDVGSIVSDGKITSLSLDNVMGATQTPVQNANITKGEDIIIQIRKSLVIEEEDVILQQNYPNPFNPNTTIRFNIKNDSHVYLKIFNMIGEEIVTLVDEYKPAGSYESSFDAGALTSGVYLYQIRSGSNIQTRKMILIK